MEKDVTIEDVRARLDNCIDLYLDFFSKKHEVTHNGWVGGIKGGIIEISDAFFSFDDIALDLDLDAPNDSESSIFYWYWDNVESEEHNINYLSYIKGLRICNL